MPLSRRAFLRQTTAGAIALAAPAAFAACAGSESESPATATKDAESPGPALTPASTGTVLSEKRGQSKGTISVAENIMPIALDANSGAAGLALMAFGIGETLMRVSRDMAVEPGLAKSVEPTTPRKWRITLRDDVLFHDGSPLDAPAVKASLELAMEKQPGVATFLPKGTTVTASGNVLEIETPVDVSLMRSNLAAFNLVVQKQSASGPVFTGPFVPGDFVAQASMTLKAFAGYRGGPARLEQINVRYVPDVNARLLALQSGDVDGAAALLPSQVPLLESAGIKVHNFLFTRANQVILNVTRAPLDNVEVRRAISFAIDRETLLKGVLDGSGRVARAFIPNDIGIRGIVETQRSDAKEAARILDAAGWLPGSDGIRARNGARLAFKLGFYASRAELEPMAVVIKDQLKAAGIQVELEKFADINSTVANSEFDATMYSYNPVPYADPGRGITQFYVQSGTNNKRYENAAVTSLFEKYNQATVEADRVAALEQMQRTFGDDVPVVYVVNPNQIHGFHKRVKSYVPHPLENYKYDAELAIDG